MYPHRYIIPNNSITMYRNNPNDGDRFLLTPFLFGGLAGTALGYGIANNNQINRQQCCGMPPVFIQPVPFPMQQQPFGNFTSTNNNTFYR